MKASRIASLFAWVFSTPLLSVAADVAGDQREVADRFARVKEAALRVAEAAEESDDARAEQVRTAIRKAQEFGVEDRLEAVVGLLEDQRLAAAAEGQQEVADRLEELLRVMLEDPREARLAEERRRLERLAREVRELAENQRTLRRASMRGADPSQCQRQARLADQAERAAESAEGIEAASPEAPSLEERLQEASESMRAAAEMLGDDAKQEDATEQQLEAQRGLEAALRDIEESLRQLREEEQQRRLAGLADRLKGMHRGESELLTDTEETGSLDGLSSRDAEVRVVALAQRQATLAREANRAARLVEADGASLVYADALRQVEQDMRVVEGRLEGHDVSESTRLLERGVVDSLAEMIDAVDESLADMDHQRQSGQQGTMSEMERRLLARLAELRMLRTVQSRLRRQTILWDEIIRREGAVTDEARAEIERLAEQQRRLSDASRHTASQQP